ncbi:MAG TPA: DUF3108 domain-containing protein [Chthoniobacterales bacterium]
MIAKIIARRLRCGRLLGRLSLTVACFGGLAGQVSAAPDWQSSLTRDTVGNFPFLRSLHATYVFGWSGFTAATAEVRFSRPAPDRCEIQGSGRTLGLVRALWKYDVTYNAIANPVTLRPVEAIQTDTYRSKKISTNLAFGATGVRSSRTEAPLPPSGPPKPKDFDFPDVFDLQTAVLSLRSQSLTDHSSYRVVVYPSTNAYLAIATVLGHERISVRSGAYDAIKIDLQLKRIGKELDLQTYKKVRRSTVWISDDADRLLLRVEAQVFVGTVFAELRSVKFDAPSSRVDGSSASHQIMGEPIPREAAAPAERPGDGE